jgi:hypothetical protein
MRAQVRLRARARLPRGQPEKAPRLFLPPSSSSRALESRGPPLSYDLTTDLRGQIQIHPWAVRRALDGAQRAAEAELAVNEVGLAW